MVLIIEVLLVFYIIYMVYLYIEDGQHRKGPLFVELECSACISSRLPPPLQRFALKGKYYFVGLTSNQTRTDFDLPAETPPVILRHSKTFFIWICVSKCNMYFTSLLAEVPLGSRGIPSCPSKALRHPDVFFGQVSSHLNVNAFTSYHTLCNSVPEI